MISSLGSLSLPVRLNVDKGGQTLVSQRGPTSSPHPSRRGSSNMGCELTHCYGWLQDKDQGLGTPSSSFGPYQSSCTERSSLICLGLAKRSIPVCGAPTVWLDVNIGVWLALAPDEFQLSHLMRLIKGPNFQATMT
ncbi:TPA: hypothetical protein ACH3X3_007137 [Trebouxia sp. C0006]